MHQIAVGAAGGPHRKCPLVLPVKLPRADQVVAAAAAGFLPNDASLVPRSATLEP